MTDRLDILTKGGAGEGWVDIGTRNQGKDNQIDESMDGQTDRQPESQKARKPDRRTATQPQKTDSQIGIQLA